MDSIRSALILPAIAILAAGSCAAPPVLRAAGGLVIVQPGYPGSTEEAREFVGKLLEAVRAAGGPGIAAGEYHNDEKAGLAAIERGRPAAGIVSLGFYLEHREALSMKPLLWSRPDEPFHLVARKGELKSLADLAGKSVAGTPLLERRFVERVLFPPPADGGPEAKSPAASWTWHPETLFSRGPRDVARGRRDAVLLSHRELEGLKRLRTWEALEEIHATAAHPVAVVVAFEGRMAAAEAGKLAAALGALGKSDAGAEVLKTMGLDSFGDVDEKRLESLEKK